MLSQDFFRDGLDPHKRLYQRRKELESSKTKEAEKRYEEAIAEVAEYERWRT